MHQSASGHSIKPLRFRLCKLDSEIKRTIRDREEWMRLTLERLCYGLWITRKNGMVQNQVTIVWLVLSPIGSVGFPPSDAIGGGPKSADVKHLGALPPLSANSDNWRRGSNFPRKKPLFANFAPHLAEGVKFPEKNAPPSKKGTWRTSICWG